jgi:WD40 repeat protein
MTINHQPNLPPGGQGNPDYPVSSSQHSQPALTESLTLPPANYDPGATMPTTTDRNATLPPVNHDPDATLAPEQTQTALSANDARAPAGYAIEKELGRGGMGVVYKARSLALQRDCALKMILSGVHSGSAEIERFRTEAQAIARLQHPGIVQVFEIGEHDGRPFMALEFCGGGSLDNVLAKNPLASKEAARLVKSLAKAMHAAHLANIIHRDLKPANVLLAKLGRESGELIPKITDFGLAKKLDEDGATRTGSVMGTPSYMPPEQADGRKDIGPSADIYALGAILYECLAGRPPFRAATPLDTLMQVLTDEPLPLRQLNHQVPVDLETIAHKCLQKDPKKRYATAQELVDDLGRFLNGEPVKARPVGVLERAGKWVRRNRVVSALVACVLLVLTVGIAVSGWFAYQAGQEAKAARQAETRANDNLRKAEWSIYASKLLLAQAAFSENNVSEAFRYLNECQWDMRGWERDHLRWWFDSSKQTLKGHTNAVYSVAWNPDGKRILTGSYDNTAKVWDAQTGQEVLALKGHTEAVSSVAWSPDGKRLVTGSWDKTALVWDAQKGQQVLILKGHTLGVNSVAWSPDGKRILTGSGDNTAKVWDVQTGQQILTLTGQTKAVWSVAWSPDGQRLLTGSLDNMATVWDAQTGQELLPLKGHTDTVSSVAWSPDGQRLLTGSGDNTAKVWDAQTGQERLSLKGHPSGVASVAWSADGQRILTGSGDRTAKVWDAQKGTELLSLKGHTGGVHGGVLSVAWSPDGQRILTGSGDNTAKLWAAVDSPRALTLKGHTGPVLSGTWSPDGQRILTGCMDPTAKVVDAQTGQELLTLKGHTGIVLSGAWSPDGQRILTAGGFDQTARVWDAKKGTELLTLKGHTKGVLSVAWSPNGQRILTSGGDSTAKVWDAQTGQELLTLKGHTDALISVAWSPDGRRILTGSGDKTAKVWDAQTGQERLTLKGHTGAVISVAWSPDGQQILTGSGDKTAKVWDVQTGQELLNLKGHMNVVNSVAWSPGGQRILTGSETAKLWDAEKGTELFTLKGHSATVRSVAWSPDGQRLLTGSEDKTAKVWDSQKSQDILTLKGHTGFVHSVAWSPKGQKVFAWDAAGKVLAWDTTTGHPTAADNPSQRPAPGPATSPDGRFSAKPDGNQVRLVDLRQAATEAWPFPDAGERKAYHTEQANLAEKEKQFFAVAFHLGRLLLDDPDNAELKRRREQALTLHTKPAVDDSPPRMQRVP